MAMDLGTIGFIGLGRMGRGMAANLRKKGFSLQVLDIDPAAMAHLGTLGAIVARDATQVARECDGVITMLPTSVEVEAVACGAAGLFAHGRPGAILMDMSTIDPLVTDRLHAQAQRAGMTVVDAPVGRLAEHADRGESLFMVGASDADFARVRPLLDAMGTTVYHCGGVGTGGRTKLVNNYIAISLCQMNAEALALSQGLGLNLMNTLQVLFGTMASNNQLKINFANKVLAGDTRPGFTIDLAHKDLGLVLGAAHAAKVPMPVAAAVYESFSMARAASFGQLDFSGIADVVCELAKIDKPRTPAGWKAPA